MKKFKIIIINIIKGMSHAGERFPLSVLSLFGAAGILFYMISLREMPGLIIQKVMFTLILAAFLSMAAQFAAERFNILINQRPFVYGVSLLLTIGYFFILWPAPEISAEIVIRTFVAVFAMFCAVLWIPSYKDISDFNKVALIHSKSIFTSFLYSGVLSVGISAIILSVDILLFKVNSDSYAYMMTIIWVLFAPIYYLSLLPKFGSEKASDI